MRYQRIALMTGVILTACVASVLADRPMRVDLNATDLPRKLLRAKVTIPLDEATRTDGKVALWYPKWVPGSHGPGGPIANVVGLRVFDSEGNRLTWRRAVGEFHRILVDVPESVDALVVKLHYATDQHSTSSIGHDSFGSALIGVVSPSSALMYPEGFDMDATRVEATLALPESWVASTAIPTRTFEGSKVLYEPVKLRTFVDSPIMCGKFRRVYELVDDSTGIPPHALHIFSEAESVLDIHPEVLQRMKNMVTQAARLFGSHPFERFDILLATSDVLPRNGLEHSRSTFNVLGQRSLQKPENLKGWDRLLVPHEYIHAWCGKYRRPQGMVTPDFHTDKATELLWVYEGLTQYLGELIEARANWMTPDEFRHRFEVEIRNAMHQQGRGWRSLADTGACSSTLRAGSRFWPRLRRSQDYYMEGMLFWIEADAIIRKGTGGDKSLDDFCQLFFRYSNDDPHPKGYNKADIVAALNQTHEFDWAGLIARRIEALVERYDPAVVDMVGYSIQYTNQQPDIPNNTFRRGSGVDAIDSIGASIGTDGTVTDLLLGSPAHDAMLGPGMKIVSVNDHVWSENRMRDAIAISATTGHLDVMVSSGDSFETHRIEYDGGPRFMTLVQQDGTRDWLAEIVKPR